MTTAKRTHATVEPLPRYRTGSEATQGTVKRNARRAEHRGHAQNGETAVSAEPCNARRNGIDRHAKHVDTAVPRESVDRLSLRALTRRNLGDDVLQEIAAGRKPVLGGVMLPETAGALFHAHEEEVIATLTAAGVTLPINVSEYDTFKMEAVARCLALFASDLLRESLMRTRKP